MRLRLTYNRSLSLEYCYAQQLRDAFKALAQESEDFALWWGKGLVTFSPLQGKFVSAQGIQGFQLLPPIAPYVGCPSKQILALIEAYFTCEAHTLAGEMLRASGGTYLNDPPWRTAMIWIKVGQSSIAQPTNPSRRNFQMPNSPDVSGQLLESSLERKWDAWRSLAPSGLGKWSDQRPEISIGQDFKRRRIAFREGDVYSWQSSVRVEAPVEVQQLIWACGLGECQDLGYGMVKPWQPAESREVSYQPLVGCRSSALSPAR